MPVAPAPLYIFEGDMGAQANMRRCVRDGLDREVVVTIQRVLIIVEMFLRAGELIKRSRSFQSSICKPWELIDHVQGGGCHFTWTIIWDPNETLICTSQLEN